MADTTTPAAATANKQIALQRIYIKDCSFESPHAPEVFTKQITPDISVNIQTSHKNIDEANVEAVLSVTAEAKHEGRTVFLVEVQQAGVFTVQGFDDKERDLILGSYCPTILFPFLREMVSDLTLKASMAPLLLQPVNFDALYAQQQQKKSDQRTNGN